MLTRRVVLPLLLLATVTLHAAAWRASGPAGGVSRVLAAAPSNQNILYLASDGGVFRSTNRGATWRNVSGPITMPTALAISPADPFTVYVSSGGGTSVYKTSDGGSSWTELAANGLKAPRFVSSIVIDPRNADVVYVASQCEPFFIDSPRAGGVFKSTDGGATFIDADNGLEGFPRCAMSMSFDAIDPDTLYVLFHSNGDDRYARSDDGAQTWTLGTTVFPATGSIADPFDPSHRYGIGDGLFLTSTDGGVTWNREEPLVLDGGTFPSHLASGIAIDPVSGRIFVAAHRGVYSSDDGGRSFLLLQGTARQSVTTLLFDRVDGALTIGTRTGVYRSNAFPWSDWTMLPTADTSLDMLHVATSLRDPATAYATSEGRVFVTHDSAYTWALLPEFDVEYPVVTALAVDAAENVYVRVLASDRMWTFKYTPDSQAWAALELSDVRGGELVADPRTPGVVYAATWSSYLVTRDGGATWNEIRLPDLLPYGLAIDPRDGSVLYAVTHDGLLRSADGGSTWTKKVTTVDPASQIAISGDGATIYVDAADVFFDRVLFRSTDRGETWTSVGRLPEGKDILSMVADPRDARTLYINSLSLGVHRSADGGATWHSIQGALPGDARLAINANGTMLHAATDRGMWELNLSPRRRSVR